VWRPPATTSDTSAIVGGVAAGEGVPAVAGGAVADGEELGVGLEDEAQAVTRRATTKDLLTDDRTTGIAATSSDYR
jgi:hypothetical protein